MNYDTMIQMADERLENEMFIDYLKDNIKELRDALDEIYDIEIGLLGLAKEE